MDAKSCQLVLLRELLLSPAWPEAVDPRLICLSESDRIERADEILDDWLSLPLDGLKVLDVGCGLGHVSQGCLERECKLSVGYDILPQNRTDRDPKLILTDNWRKVVENAPYDIVIAYDVLDHIMPPDSPKETLERIKGIMSRGSTLAIRCHPWTSRHGSHLYDKLNKAYAHLIFDEDELESMGLKSESTRKDVSYKDLLADFYIDKETALCQPVEPFFTRHSLVADRIKHTIEQMERQFIDYRIVIR